MKIMFLDESGDHSLEKIDASYPIFALAGCIFDFEYYHSKVEPLFQSLKKKHFGNTAVILRSYDIRKQKGNFACLVDKQKREEFYKDLNVAMSGMEYSIIAGVINKTQLKSQYSVPANPYHLCFQFIMERAVMFLGSSGESLMFRIESRETHNDKILAQEYENFKKGTERFKAAEIEKKFADLSFNQKSQNIIGMQVADLVAYPIGRWGLDSEKGNKAFEIVRPKIHSKGGKILGYGFKLFP